MAEYQKDREWVLGMAGNLKHESRLRVLGGPALEPGESVPVVPRGRLEQAEAKVREFHKALSEGNGVEDGGIWEDRALAAEARLEQAHRRDTAKEIAAWLRKHAAIQSTSRQTGKTYAAALREMASNIEIEFGDYYG